ncbi:MAG: ABC transporter substrate-binding protein [Pseudomonadota bacterium]
MIRLAIFIFFAATASAGAAPRVMSTDFCADQFILKLADREQIAALSPDADNDFSYLRREAAGLPRTRPDAESVVSYAPDVVLRFWGGDEARLRALDLHVVTLKFANNFEDVIENIRTAAAALEKNTQGDALIADMRDRLAALASAAHTNPEALYVTPGGVTAGKGTMIDAILNAAGVRNIAAEQGLSFWPPLPAEAVVAAPPALIVAGFFSANSERISHWSAARHPAFRKVFDQTPSIHLPTDVLSCPAWYSVDAAEIIASAIRGDDAE